MIFLGEADAIKLTADARSKAIAMVASGEANATLMKAEAQSRAINMVSKALEAQVSTGDFYARVYCGISEII